MLVIDSLMEKENNMGFRKRYRRSRRSFKKGGSRRKILRRYGVSRGGIRL